MHKSLELSPPKHFAIEVHLPRIVADLKKTAEKLQKKFQRKSAHYRGGEICGKKVI
jgi:hypothetical protein